MGRSKTCRLEAKPSLRGVQDTTELELSARSPLRNPSWLKAALFKVVKPPRDAVEGVGVRS